MTAEARQMNAQHDSIFKLDTVVAHEALLGAVQLNPRPLHVLRGGLKLNASRVLLHAVKDTPYICRGTSTAGGHTIVSSSSSWLVQVCNLPRMVMDSESPCQRARQHLRDGVGAARRGEFTPECVHTQLDLNCV